MRDLEKYKGIIPAFYACYDEDGEVSPERIQMLATHYLEVGVKGLYVGGSSGECIYQTVNERKIVLENVMKAVGGKMTIIAHIAAPSTRDSLELAKHAESLGVDALAAIPPIYFVLPEDAIENYWTSMVEATDLDFIIYNIPQTTGYALSVTLLNKMLAHEQVIGVKNSSMPVLDINTFKLESNKELIIFNGPDEQFLGGRSMGADAGIGGTYGVMPQAYLTLDRYIRHSQMREALDLQNDINKIIFKMVSCQGNLYDVMKYILSLDGLKIGQARLPLPRMVETDFAIAKEAHEMIQKLLTKLN